MDGCKRTFCHIQRDSQIRDAGDQIADIDDHDAREHGSIVLGYGIIDEESLSEEETIDTYDESTAGSESLNSTADSPILPLLLLLLLLQLCIYTYYYSIILTFLPLPSGDIILALKLINSKADDIYLYYCLY